MDAMRRELALLVGAAAVAMLSAAAMAQDVPTRSIENGVTVLRGPRGAQSTNSAITANPSAVTPGLSGSTYNRGPFNAVHTGSENAGGAIVNPPPGAGQ
jgi:hypothetical protein